MQPGHNVNPFYQQTDVKQRLLHQVLITWQLTVCLSVYIYVLWGKCFLAPEGATGNLINSLKECHLSQSQVGLKMIKVCWCRVGNTTCLACSSSVLEVKLTSVSITLFNLHNATHCPWSSCIFGSVRNYLYGTKRQYFWPYFFNSCQLFVLNWPSSVRQCYSSTRVVCW